MCGINGQIGKWHIRVPICILYIYIYNAYNCYDGPYRHHIKYVKILQNAY